MKRRKCMADGGVLEKANERVRQAVGGFIPVSIGSGLVQAIAQPIAEDWRLGNQAVKAIRDQHPAVDAIAGIHPAIAAAQVANDVMAGNVGADTAGNVAQMIPVVRRANLLVKGATTVPGVGRFAVNMPATIKKNAAITEAQTLGQPANAFANGGMVRFAGAGGAREDKIPVKVAGQSINVSDGEAAVILPAKTAANAAALGIIGQVIKATNDGREPKGGMVDGGKYAAGALPEEDGRSKFLSSLPEGGILRTPEGRQQAAQAITNAPAIGAPLTIGGGQPAPTAPSIYAPAYAGIRKAAAGEGLRPDVGITGPRAVPQQASFSNEGGGSAVLASNLAVQAPPVPAAVVPAVPATASTAAPAGVPAPSVAEPPAKFPQPNEPVPSGTGFIRNSRTGAVTPVGGPSIASPAPQLSVATPARFGVLEAIQPAAQPTDTNRYRQTAEKILLDESRGPGGGVAARLLMGLAGRAAGMDNDAARTLNETQAVAARAQQAAAELASTDSYRRSSLGIQDREQTMREQESADKLQDTAAQRAARTGIADAIESGDEAKIKKAHAKGIAAGVLKSTDERKHEESPYRIHTDTTSGDQVRINQKTGATDRLDRATNTWQPVGASQPKQAPQAAIDALRANPALAAQFQQKYGYLPQ